MKPALKATLARKRLQRRADDELRHAEEAAYYRGRTEASSQSADSRLLRGLFGQKLDMAVKALAQEIARKEIGPLLDEAALARYVQRQKEVVELYKSPTMAIVQNAYVRLDRDIQTDSTTVEVGMVKPFRYNYSFYSEPYSDRLRL